MLQAEDVGLPVACVDRRDHERTGRQGDGRPKSGNRRAFKRLQFRLLRPFDTSS